MTLSRYCVLDVETAPSPDALRWLPRGDRASIERVALHELTAVATLSFAQAGDEFLDFELASVWAGEGGEADLLQKLAISLKAGYGDGVSLVTFNGGHDLSVLRRRAGRHWLFGAFDLPRWSDGQGHIDLMHVNRFGGARSPSLVDACAGFGFGIAPPVRCPAGAHVPDPVRKCELDVAATSLLLFHELSFRAGTPMPLIRGWCALADHLRPQLRARPHLAQLVRHPNVGEARGVMACVQVADAPARSVGF